MVYKLDEIAFARSKVAAHTVYRQSCTPDS